MGKVLSQHAYEFHAKLHLRVMSDGQEEINSSERYLFIHGVECWTAYDSPWTPHKNALSQIRQLQGT